jgi:hypothetical protein
LAVGDIPAQPLADLAKLFGSLLDALLQSLHEAGLFVAENQRPRQPGMSAPSEEHQGKDIERAHRRHCDTAEHGQLDGERQDRGKE